METTILVACIGAEGTVVAACVGAWIKKRDTSSDTVSKAASQDAPLILDSKAVHIPQKDQPAQEGDGTMPGPTTGVELRDFSLAHGHIDKSIKDAPIYHREDIAKSYIGLRVCWLGNLTSIRRVSERLRTASFMLVEDRTSLFCHFVPEDGTALIPLREQAIVEVRGEIKDVSEGQTILVNCTFRPLM